MKYSEIIINTDGGARGNPGPAAIGVIAKANEQVLFEISEYIGHQTNNVAEYTAVIHALKHLQEHGLKTETLIFVLDSELIVRQILGQYKIKQPHLVQLYKEVKELITTLTNNETIRSIKFQNVLRGKNILADALVNHALDSHK